jgi:hypothetical protein
VCKDKRDYRLLSTDLNKVETKIEGGDEVCIVLLNSSSIGQSLLPYMKSAIRRKGIVSLKEKSEKHISCTETILKIKVQRHIHRYYKQLSEP